MKLSIKHPFVSALAVVCAAVTVPTAAWAGSTLAPPGIYTFTGLCGVGCQGSMSGTLNTTPGAASMIMNVALNPPATLPTSSIASASEAPSLVMIPVINFGPLLVANLDLDDTDAYVQSNSYRFISDNTGAWTLAAISTPLAVLSAPSPLSFSQMQGVLAATTLATGTNIAFVRPPVPEPQSLLLLLAGLGVVGAAVRRGQGSSKQG